MFKNFFTSIVNFVTGVFFEEVRDETTVSVNVDKYDYDKSFVVGRNPKSTVGDLAGVINHTKNIGYNRSDGVVNYGNSKTWKEFKDYNRIVDEYFKGLSY